LICPMRDGLLFIKPLENGKSETHLHNNHVRVVPRTGLRVEGRHDLARFTNQKCVAY
jgi:hypothetical protein